MFLVFVWKVIRLLFHPDLQNTEWKKHPELRKYSVHELIKNNDWLGKSKSEIESVFGKDESGKHLASRWSYYIETRRKRSYYLIFDFRNDDVIKVRYKTKKAL